MRSTTDSPTNATGAGSTGSPGSTSDPHVVIDQAKEKAGQMVDQVKQEASKRFAGQIGTASQSLHSASEALRDVSGQLREKEQKPVADVADRFAERVDSFSSYLENKGLDQIVGDVESFARSQPAAFIGAAFALGLAASRFLKSGPQAETSASYESTPSEVYYPSADSSSNEPSSYGYGTSSQTQPLHSVSTPQPGANDGGTELRDIA